MDDRNENHLTKPNLTLMNTLKFQFSVLLSFLLVLFLVSCQDETAIDFPEEEISTDEISDDEAYYLTAAAREDESSDLARDFRFKRMCLQPVFPLTLVFPNDSTLEVNNLREIKEAFIRWNRSDRRGHPVIAFPHEVELPDGNIITVENREQLRRLLRQCLKKVRPKLDSCYQLVYPLDVSLGNGTTHSVNSKEELNMLIREWVQNHRDSLLRPHLIFPLEILMQDGTILEVQSPQELAAITRDCLPARDRCFEWVFPITMEIGDHLITVNSRHELTRLLRRYANDHRNHPHPHIVFPQEVVVASGETITINNREELKRLLESCRQG